MPNIKYFLGTEEERSNYTNILLGFSSNCFSGGTVTDSISGNVATLTSSNASCSVSGWINYSIR